MNTNKTVKLFRFTKNLDSPDIHTKPVFRLINRKKPLKAMTKDERSGHYRILKSLRMRWFRQIIVPDEMMVLIIEHALRSGHVLTGMTLNENNQMVEITLKSENTASLFTLNINGELSSKVPEEITPFAETILYPVLADYFGY